MSRYMRPSRRGTCTECGEAIALSWSSAAKPRCRDCQRRNPKPRHKAGPHSIVRWTCERCGKVCERPPTKGQHPKWCSNECATTYPKVCAWCGVMFTTTDKKSKTCCITHGLWLSNHGAPSQSKELVVVPREPKPRVSRVNMPAQAKPWWRVIVQGRCAWCGDYFTALTTTHIRYCSDRCRDRAGRHTARLRRGRFTVPLQRRRRLYERDGWTCRICGEATSWEWTSGDPWSPTLDHIEPQSATLLPDHSDGNLRTAHTLCNSIRSDGVLTDAEVSALVAERRVARDVVV